MTTIHERSAGVIPFRVEGDRGPHYLVLHSATVRNPRAKWEFPKGGMEPGEAPRDTAAREFTEETGLTDWAFRDGFERSLSYTYIRRGRKVIKTVTYFVIEVLDARFPRASENPVVTEARRHKPCIKVLSKSDLADAADSEPLGEFEEGLIVGRRKGLQRRSAAAAQQEQAFCRN